MKRIICLLFVLVMMFTSTNPYVFSNEITVVSEEDGNGHIVLNPVKFENNIIALSGKYCGGGGYDITLTITDNFGNIYAIAQTITKNNGVFSFEAGLVDDAAYTELTATIKPEGDTPYVIKLNYDVDISFFDIAVEKGITNRGNIVMGGLSESGGKVLISGNYSLGAGYDIAYRVVDSENKTVYANGDVVSKSAGKFSIVLNLPDTSYGRRMTCYVLGEEETEEASVTFVYIGGINKYRTNINQCISEMQTLISECEEENISVEYEKSNLAIVQRFTEILEGFYNNKNIEEYEHNYTKILQLSEETVDDLQGYLDGSKLQKIAPIYQNSKLITDGQSLIADVYKNGVVKQQPVFFNGLGHWSSAVSDFENFSKMGINSTHYEIGPNSILKSVKSDGSYEINTAGIDKAKNVFADAEENDISVVLLTAMHYFPQFIYDKYPEIVNNKSSEDFWSFMPYNPTHPEVERAIRAYLEALIPEIKNYKSLQSVCIANEPLMHVADCPEYYLPYYKEFLKNKYGTIAKLNSAYGTSYSSFDKLTITGFGSIGQRNVDVREFNDLILIEWFTYIKDVMKEIAPEIPVHIKCTAYISDDTDGSRRTDCGTNAERWSEITDLNGCDAWGLYDSSTRSIQGKMMWYDFMTSLKNAPIVNSEDHIIMESETITYDDNELKSGMADVWQGAVHGRASSVYWMWDTSDRTKPGTWYHNTNMINRVDYVAGIAKISHDLNRLANEVTAIQKKPARTAILYSNYSQANVPKHCAAMFEAYKCLTHNGEKVFVANDTFPEKINENENLELLIVPGCNYMPESVWEEIKKFEQRGKKVIFAELSKNYYNESGKSISSTLANEVLNGATRVSFAGNENSISSSTNVANAINSALSGFDYDVRISGANSETEWSFAEFDGGYVVNVCNYSNEDVLLEVTPAVTENGYSIVDLTENESISGNTFTLEPNATKLLKIEQGNNEFRLYAPDGSETKNIVSGKMKAKLTTKIGANQNFVYIAALYDGTRLLECAVSSGVADNEGKIDEVQDISVPQADDMSTFKIKAFVLDRTTTLEPITKSFVK